MNKPLLDTLPPWPWEARKNEEDPCADWGTHELEYSVLCTDGYYVAQAEERDVATLMALAPELVEALQYCECELTLYQGLAEQSENPQAWYDAIAKARTVLNKLKGEQNDQPTLW